MPKFVDFTQHLIAPLGNVISVELHNVQFNLSNCADNATIEVSDGTIELCDMISLTFHIPFHFFVLMAMFSYSKWKYYFNFFTMLFSNEDL